MNTIIQHPEMIKNLNSFFAHHPFNRLLYPIPATYDYLVAPMIRCPYDRLYLSFTHYYRMSGGHRENVWIIGEI